MPRATKFIGDVTVTGTLSVGATINNGVLESDLSIADGKQIQPDGATATAVAGAATLSKQCGVVTSEAITTAAGAAYTLTLTNTLIAATSILLVSFANGTNTQGTLELSLVTPGAGSATIVIRNTHASQALNGTIKISFLVLNPA